MIIQCPKCHYENPEDKLYCGKCGTELYMKYLDHGFRDSLIA
ncbi:MAG: zinc-ribbon domain-containing protein [Candidatus Aminicenantes bacterium]|nr:zinc-ribbon domain-containing protein [Candidatus Aminicenantes bacterium]TET69550.1 MAG: zinc-ribbon domain-containing protein [Candidatus Aminicenantes bacterium]